MWIITTLRLHWSGRLHNVWHLYYPRTSRIEIHEMARVLKSDPLRKTCQEPTKDRTELKIELDDLSCENIFRNADLYTLNCKINADQSESYGARF